MTTASTNAPRDREQIGWGVFLIGLGVWFLLIMNGTLPRDAWHTWWPYLVIAMGVVGLFSWQNPKSLGSAVTTIGMGLWMATAVNHWYDLGWGDSWPLALVAVGLGTLAEWAASVSMARREGGDHVR
jgi:MFS superfamily sulfate permease-like transporter